MSSKRATIGALEGVLPGVVGARRGFPHVSIGSTFAFEPYFGMRRRRTDGFEA